MSQLTTSRSGYTYNILTWSRAAFKNSNFQELADAGYFRNDERVVFAVKYLTVGDTTYKFEYVTNYEIEGSAVGYFSATAFNNDRGYPSPGFIVIQGLSYRTQDILDFWEHAAINNYYVNTYLSAV